jgi:ceramide glucosyltransferase
MAVRRKNLSAIGGFSVLADFLADDFQLGHRLAQNGAHLELCPVVVECWDQPMTTREVWQHQLRWARTVRVCRPMGFFFSGLTNATLWPLLWLVFARSGLALEFFCAALLVRILTAQHLQSRLHQTALTLHHAWLVPVKDLWQFAVWLAAHWGNHIAWRGEQFRLRRDGKLERLG